MHVIQRETRGRNLLSAGSVWAWENTLENTLPEETIILYHCDLWFGRLLVICVWGNTDP